MAAYLRPRSVPDALALLVAQPGLRVLAGGTDVFPAVGEALARTDLLDLAGIEALQVLREDADGLRIGALVTWTQLQRSVSGPGYAALLQAGREVGSPQIQNAATVVGNVCNASPAADGTVALMALEAEVEIAGPGGTRRVALADFVTGPRRTALGAGEIVQALVLPPATGASAFLKLGARRYMVISIAMVAVHVDRDPQGRIARARLAVGACAPVARRQPRLEAALVGAGAGDLEAAVRPDLLDGLAPITDVRAGADYRADAVPVLLRRALRACLEDPHA